jgi:hypothetical protein
MHKDITQLTRAARQAGWKVTLRGSGHLCFRPPAGRFVIGSQTPHGGRHGLDRLRGDLRRAGLVLR